MVGARSKHVDDCLSGCRWQFSSPLDKCLVGVGGGSVGASDMKLGPLDEGKRANWGVYRVHWYCLYLGRTK